MPVITPPSLVTPKNPDLLQNIRGLSSNAPKIYGAIITLRVGPDDPTDFHVHGELLCDHSPFFANAMKKKWTGDNDRILELPDDKPGSIEVYLVWLYSNRIFKKPEGEVNKDSGVRFDRLIDAYIFGDKIQDSDFKDAIIDALIERDIEDITFFIDARKIWESTPPGALIRRYMVDIFVWEGVEDWLGDDVMSYLNQDFLVELGRALYKRIISPKDYTGVAPYVRDSCLYHEHISKGEPCYKASTRTIQCQAVIAVEKPKANERTSPQKPDATTSVRKPMPKSVKITGSIVTVRVGDPTTDFYIHEQLLCEHSPFFRNGMKRGRRKAKERVIHLPDDKVKIFTIYHMWLYFGYIFTRSKDEEKNASSTSSTAEWELLFDSYIFGMKIHDSNFKDALMDAIINKMNTIDKFPEKVQQVYQNTPQNSPARRLLVEVCLYYDSEAFIQTAAGNAEYLQDVALAFMNAKKTKRDFTCPAEGSCEYHEHAEGEENCYKKR